jgi:hypothetical protein
MEHQACQFLLCEPGIKQLAPGRAGAMTFWVTRGGRWFPRRCFITPLSTPTPVYVEKGPKINGKKTAFCRRFRGNFYLFYRFFPERHEIAL